jgi:hypothetical protein
MRFTHSSCQPAQFENAAPTSKSVQPVKLMPIHNPGYYVHVSTFLRCLESEPCAFGVACVSAAPSSSGALPGASSRTPALSPSCALSLNASTSFLSARGPSTVDGACSCGVSELSDEPCTIGVCFAAPLPPAPASSGAEPCSEPRQRTVVRHRCRAYGSRRLIARVS